MGDLKTPWPEKDQPTLTPGLSGAGIISSGSDPNADGGDGPAALQPLWTNPPTMATSTAESANSVSGLPAHPNRYEPAGAPPDPPDLTQRSPGTVDKQ